MIAVSTVKVEAAAEVAKEALGAIGIPVEIRRLGANPYFGSVTREEWEIRVPEDDVDAALAELDRIAEDTEQAVYAEAGVPASIEEDAGDDELHVDEERPKKVSWALVISLLLPFPGGGCMYARANAVGLTIFGVSVGLLVAAVLGAQIPNGAGIWVGAKLVDLALAPLCVWRFNRKLAEEKNAARS